MPVVWASWLLGEPLKHQIPSDYRVAVEAVNTGIPLVLGDSKLAKSVRALATDLAESAQRGDGRADQDDDLGKPRADAGRNLCHGALPC